MNESDYMENAEKQIKNARETLLQSRQKGAFADLLSEVRGLTVYRLWQIWLSLFRKFRFFAFLLRIFTAVWAILQTGAWIFLSTVLFLILFPLLFAILPGVLLTALLESRRSNRQMKTRLCKKRVYVLFFDGKTSPFFVGNLSDLSKRSDACVLLVSAFWLSPKGAFERKKERFYFTFREDCDRVFLVRRYYFFSLRKKVLKPENCVYIY